MNKPLNNRQKGKLRSQKLKELAESGKLAMIKTRGDLAEAVGYPYAQRNTSGYQWIHHKIERGELVERIAGYTDDGYAEYEYQYVEPNKNPNPIKEVFKPQVIEDKQETPTVLATSMVITITRGDTTVRIENATKEALAEIVKAIKA